MAKLAKKGKPAKADGNIVVDLGEEVDKVMVKKIDQKLAAAGVIPKREKMAGPGESRFGGYRPGGYRPGMYGYRPWYADKGSGMGSSMSYSSRWKSLMRPNLGHLSVGALIGALGNAGLVRVTPSIVKGTDLNVVHQGIAFTVGLIPVLARPNSYTLGVAVPGAMLFASAIFNLALDSMGVQKPALRGSEPAGAAPAAPRAIDASSASVRAKLQEVHGRLSNPAAPVARVQARAIA